MRDYRGLRNTNYNPLEELAECQDLVPLAVVRLVPLIRYMCQWR
jgi:hypothetical protein